MQENQRGTGTTEETPEREAELRVRTGEPLRPVRETSDKPPDAVEPDELSRERHRARLDERNRIQREAVWQDFLRTERRELELRRQGQLGELLGAPVSGEPPEALEHLAREDLRQAQEGMVALMSGGKLSYKHLDELSPADMPARIAAERLRTTWLKERQDRWLAYGRGRS